jgi:putative ABC transport system substrate-binding protein
MRRREFVAFVGAAAAAWPVAARAQEKERVRSIGVLEPLAVDDPEALARVTALAQALQQLGWTVGRNIRIEYRWGAGDADRIRQEAAELVALAPDAILTVGASTTAPMLRATSTVPVVFVAVVDPVGASFVDSMARPGGNATGFTNFEYSMGAKWLELLKEVAPGVTRAAVIRDPDLSLGAGQFAAVQTASPSLGIEAKPVNVADTGEIERVIAAFARPGNGGLVVTGSGLAALHRNLLIRLAARHRLPAVYFERYFVTAGGLISYGTSVVEQHRLGVTYIDRILRGEKPADLPVQAPNKYELVANLKAAKALGLSIPTSVLARADEVIE